MEEMYQANFRDSSTMLAGNYCTYVTLSCIDSQVTEHTIFYNFSRMLDDFGHEMENTQSKMENTLSKVAKVMHLSSGK